MKDLSPLKKDNYYAYPVMVYSKQTIFSYLAMKTSNIKENWKFLDPKNYSLSLLLLWFR